jgi:hypothetical protein
MILITCSIQQCTKQVFNKVLYTIFEKKSLILIFLAFWVKESIGNSNSEGFDFVQLLTMIENIQLHSVLVFLSQNFGKYFPIALFFIIFQSIYSSVVASHFEKEYARERIKIRDILMSRIFHYQKINPGRINTNKLFHLQKFHMDAIEQVIQIIASFIVFVILSAFLPRSGTLWLEVCAIILAVVISVFFLTYFIQKQIDSQIMQTIYSINWFNIAFADIVYFFFFTASCYFIPLYILNLRREYDKIKSINLFIFYVVLFQNALVSNRTFFKDFIRSWMEIRNIMEETKTPSFKQKISSLSVSSPKYSFQFSSGNTYWICSEPSLQEQLQNQIIFGEKKIDSVLNKSVLLEKCNIVGKENSDLSIIQYFQLAIHDITSEDIIKTLSLCKFFEGEEFDFISDDFLQQKCSLFPEEQQTILSIARAILDRSEVLILKDCFRSMKEEREKDIVELFGNKKIVIIFSGSKRPPTTDSFINTLNEIDYRLYTMHNRQNTL